MCTSEAVTVHYDSESPSIVVFKMSAAQHDKSLFLVEMKQYYYMANHLAVSVVESWKTNTPNIPDMHAPKSVL